MVYGLLRAFMRSFIDRSAGRDDTDQPPIALARQGRTGRRQENE
jgi:hypothetical protein